jgi:oligopeptide transport system ATP-binding protein
VGFQLSELFRKHRGMTRADGRKRAIELLDLVKIPAARQRVNDFPHQFSGGMRQRVMIAMSLALDPELLIADEPTTALDVTVQAQIMSLLAALQRERNMGLILITHDMGVVADVADRINVMYAGRIVEKAPVYDIYAKPSHPYTKALLESIPRVDLKGQQLNVIKGLPPSLIRIPEGCAFHPRCRYAQEVCRADPPPPLYQVEPAINSACHFWKEVRGDD